MPETTSGAVPLGEDRQTFGGSVRGTELQHDGEVEQGGVSGTTGVCGGLDGRARGLDRPFGWLGREHEATIDSRRTDIHLRLARTPQRSHENEHRLARIA